MKKIIRSSVFIFLAVVLSTSAFAQGPQSASADVSATIIAPIAISKTADLAFGSIAVGPSGGTVTVAATDGARTKTGDISLSGGAGTAASFTVTGQGTSTFSIGLPSSFNVTNGGNTMSVGTFVCDAGGTGTLVAGSKVIKVGATITVAGSQVAGAYTASGALTVTVNYN